MARPPAPSADLKNLTFVQQNAVQLGKDRGLYTCAAKPAVARHM